jgi:transcriptional regulator with XRE-family HTH domain
MQAATDARLDTPTPGERIRTAREAVGLSRERLAYEAEVSTSTVARLELSSRLPNALALARIAARVGVPIADLIPGGTAPSSG